MSVQYTEQVFLRNITEHIEPPAPMVTSDDLNAQFEFEGIVKLTRILNSGSEEIFVDSSEEAHKREYVFDIISIDRLQKES